MANYTRQSRLSGAEYGTFRGKVVVFPSFNMDLLTEFVTYEIPPEYEHRPDLIAIDQYGTDQLWWLIMQYNNIDHVKQLKTGKRIKVPVLPAGIL